MDAIRLSHRYQKRVHAHAAQKLAAPQSNSEQLAQAARVFLRLEDERLKTAARLGADGRQLAAARSFALDLLVRHAFAAATQAHGDAQHLCAVVAIGGYGRAELAPYSDLDLLFLIAERWAADARPLVERTLHILWDAGLTIGHKSQSVRACLNSSRADLHLQTALVHTRLLAGNQALHAQLTAARSRLRRKQKEAFITAVCRARGELHLRHEAIIYLQEPNVKEGVGALRDLHAALWAADARFGCATLAELAAHKHITLAERATVERAYEFLLRVRAALHWLTGRKAERLALDRQSEIAAQFGYRSTLHLRASEQFMRDYYRRARELYLFSEALLARAAAPTTNNAPARWFARPRRAHLADLFAVKDRQLHLAGEATRLGEQPLLSFEAIALAQTAGVSLNHELRAQIARQTSAIDRTFRHEMEAARLFLTILRRRGRVGAALRLMHETNLLGRYLPEFARVSLLIQHDLYHHYTVDEHTLRAIEALDELSRTEDRARAHLRAALHEVEDVALLYLALLLHDIGKGRGGGHIARGARIAAAICARLQLDESSTQRVVNLVRCHVLMAHVSQRRDLRDPRTSEQFAAQLGSLDELNMLLLLTYADLNAVAPGVWSEWKGALLQELYTRARTQFTGGALAVADDVTRLKEQVAGLSAGALPTSEIERHFALLPARYTQQVTAQAVVAHLRLLAELQQDVLACRWTPHATSNATELTVAAPDRRGLFADLAGALAAHGLEILSADLNTRADAVALDTFMLREAATHTAVGPHRWPAVERALRAAVSGELDVAAAVERYRTRHAPRRPRPRTLHAHTAPLVMCSNEIAANATVVEVRAADEHGLAHRIAHALTACALDITCAKIATEKADALDVFYVTDAAGQKLSEATMQLATERLRHALAPVGREPVSAAHNRTENVLRSLVK